MQINDVYIFRLRTVTSMFLNGEGVGPRLSGLCVCVGVCVCVSLCVVVWVCSGKISF